MFSVLCSLGAAFSSLYPCNNHDKSEIIHNSKDHLLLFDWDFVFKLEGIIKQQKERLSHKNSSVLSPPSVPFFCFPLSLSLSLRLFSLSLPSCLSSAPNI